MRDQNCSESLLSSVLFIVNLNIVLVYVFTYKIMKSILCKNLI